MRVLLAALGWASARTGLPENSADRAALIRVYDASTEEVTERARKAWARGQ